MNLLNLADSLDRAATLALNSLHVPLTDAVWMLFSDKKVWYPFYLIMVVLLFTRMNWKKALIVLVSVVQKKTLAIHLNTKLFLVFYMSCYLSW